jgi:hypothetical protein
MRLVLTIVAALAMAALVAGCGASTGPQPTTSDSSGIAPDTTALSLRARQIVDAVGADAVALERGGTPDGIDGLRRKGHFTPALVQQEEAAIEYDLMSCSQNPLGHYDLGTQTIVDGRGKIEVSGSYSTGPFTFTYEFVKTATGWKLDRVVCPPP